MLYMKVLESCTRRCHYYKSKEVKIIQKTKVLIKHHMILQSGIRQRSYSHAQSHNQDYPYQHSSRGGCWNKPPWRGRSSEFQLVKRHPTYKQTNVPHLNDLPHDQFLQDLYPSATANGCKPPMTNCEWRTNFHFNCTIMWNILTQIITNGS